MDEIHEKRHMVYIQIHFYRLLKLIAISLTLFIVPFYFFHFVSSSSHGYFRKKQGRLTDHSGNKTNRTKENKIKRQKNAQNIWLILSSFIISCHS